jgi:hypothetical protein
LLKSEATDIKAIPLYFPIAKKEVILSILREMGNIQNLPMQLKNNMQKKIDSLVFTYFGLENQADLVTSELIGLFNFRSRKART